jgi:hypothetical protein
MSRLHHKPRGTQAMLWANIRKRLLAVEAVSIAALMLPA